MELEEVHPDLADRAKEMNKRDNFRMKYDPVEIERREREEKEDETEEMDREEKKEEENLETQQPGHSARATLERDQSATQPRGTPTVVLEKRSGNDKNASTHELLFLLDSLNRDCDYVQNMFCEE